MKEIDRDNDPVSVVEDINAEMWEAIEALDADDKLEGQHPGDVGSVHGVYFLSSGGDYEAICLGDTALWDNQNDPVPWDEAGNERAMTLKAFVLKNMATHYATGHALVQKLVKS